MLLDFLLLPLLNFVKMHAKHLNLVFFIIESTVDLCTSITMHFSFESGNIPVLSICHLLGPYRFFSFPQ